MEKYYKMTDESPAYIAAIVLNPNAKWKYIKNNQKKAQQTKAKAIMQKLQKEYKLITTTATSLAALTSQESKSSRTNAFNAQKKRHQAMPSVKDEYKRYCAAECTYEVDPRTWQIETT